MAISVLRTESARDDNTQHPAHLYKRVTYNTPNIQTTAGALVYLGVLPANCFPGETKVRINTTFDGLLTVGTSGDASLYATTADVTAGTAGIYVTNRNYGVQSTSDVPVYVQLTTGSTVGEADIWLTFTPAK